MTSTIKSMFALSLISVMAFTVSCQNAGNIERPRETWVFRSVIDQRPRMVTAALSDNMWVSYDARTGNLYKAWKGGVDFDGAVYTTAHGPQPTSEGYAYISDPSDEGQWKVIRDGQDVDFEFKYGGHTLRKGRVYFIYKLWVNGESEPIVIRESPEYVEDDRNQPGLERVFTTSGMTSGTELYLHEVLTSLPNPEAYSTNGEFIESGSGQTSFQDLILYEVAGELKLNSNAKTSLTIYFQKPGDEAIDVAMRIEEFAGHPGAALIEASDCKTCHNETKKTIGPSYVEVDQKYPDSENVRNRLVDKIINGGSGVWGDVLMTAHPTVSEEDAGQMVDYILALVEEEEDDGDVWLGIPSSLLNVTEENTHEQLEEGTEYPGLAVNVFKVNVPALSQIWDDTGEVSMDDVASASGDPVLGGTISTVHLTSAEDLGSLNNWVYIEFKGDISVQQERTYSFRLISDDGSSLLINGEEIIDHGGLHGPDPKDGEVTLRSGKNEIKLQFFQAGSGAGVSLQWADTQTGEYEVIPESAFTHSKEDFREIVPYVAPEKLVRSIPGDKQWVAGVHPSFDVARARPEWFKPKVGGMDFFDDGRLVVCTWDSIGPVYLLEGVMDRNPEEITVTKIAEGLAEPLGIKVVDGEIYVLQKQELTKLVDSDGDKIIDEYLTICDGWKVSSNFHEFAFGLVYQDGYFYATLATAILPGGASANPQIPDRGKVVKINKDDGSFEFVAAGLRTPNGIGIGVDNEIFIADNQGDWLPSSKIVHVKPGAWYGSRSVDYEGTEGMPETLPVVWLPQDDIGNSPTQPLYLDKGPYAGQMMHGEVTHGGIKRVYTEKVDGVYQGVVFRFTQGLEGGVNRLVWGPDGALYVGMIGNPGNWSQVGKEWYGLQKLTFNGQTAFEMLQVKAKSNGVELVFTEPIERDRAADADEFEIRQWYYEPTADYGGPKLGMETLEVASVNVSDDRTRVFLELQGMKENHIVHVRITDPFVSVNNNSLWTTEAWYTMNKIPKDTPGFSAPASPIATNTLSEKEVEEGWELLFDGVSTSGWRNFRKETIGSAWKVRDGAIMLDNSNKDGWQIKDGGDIITNRSYDNYELYLEWKIQENGNSGIIYNVIEDDQYDYVWQTGPEMQVLDNVGHPDGRIETHRSSDLYDLIQCRFVSANGPGEWNRVRLIKDGPRVQHWLNGYKVVEYELWTDEWNELVANSKFNEMPAFGTGRGGHIALQDHGDKVWYRNIKIRKLDDTGTNLASAEASVDQ